MSEEIKTQIEVKKLFEKYKMKKLLRGICRCIKKRIEIENKKEKLINKLERINRRMIREEIRSIFIQCPFCCQGIEIKGGHIASCEFCEFTIGLSTVSDEQDEYIFYHTWFKKPLVVVKKISKEELYQGRYMKPSNLNEVLRDQRVIRIGNAWRNGIEVKNIQNKM